MKKLLLVSALIGLLGAACGGGGGDTASSPSPDEVSCEPSGTTLSISANDIEFSTNCLAAPAGQEFTIRFDNREAQPHNVLIKRANGDTAFREDPITGPKAVDYKVGALDAGEYAFSCEVHPEMTGTLIVK